MERVEAAESRVTADMATGARVRSAMGQPVEPQVVQSVDLQQYQGTGPV